MALTFTSWTAYTDDDGNARTLDWSGTTGLLSRAHLEALRQALVERCTVTGTTVPASLGSGIAAGAARKYSPLRADMQSTVTTLIAKFADHTAAVAGSFAGQSSVPAWTEANILAAIAPGTTRLSLKVGAPDRAAWSLQQYEILRRLQWSRQPETSATDPWQSHIVSSAADTRSVNAGTWADAVAAFNAAAWVNFSTWTSQALTVAYQFGGDWYLQRTRTSVTITPLVAAPHTLDFYALCHRYYKTVFPTVTYGAYVNSEYGVGVRTYARAASQASDGAANLTLTVNDFGDWTIAEGDADPADRVGWQNGYGEPSGSARWVFVLKHDVAGGFTFGSA